MKKQFFFLLLIVQAVFSFAQPATVDTVSFYSKALQNNTKAVVIKPLAYLSKQSFPVLYLLHGYSGDYRNWITKVPLIKDYATTYNMIVVCPDGENSWYVNEPGSNKNQFENFISTELVNYIDKNYATLTDKNHRAISGLSMGGHGALTLATKHPQVFGAAGSMSGAVDMLALKSKYNTNLIAGDSSVTHFKWKNHSALELMDSTRAKELTLIIDCGVEDIFIEHNRSLHQKLLTQKIKHDYIERAGGHNWYYWENSLPYQMLFFKRYFDRE